MSIQINKKAICITNDRKLAAVISSYFFDAGNYFSMFDFPLEDNKSIYSKITNNRANILVGNAIKRIRPEMVIFAGLDNYQLSFFNYIPPKRKIIINSIEEIDEKLAVLNIKFTGIIECRLNQLELGLCLAKQRKKLLKINEVASDIAFSVPQPKEISIVVEKSQKIEDLIAINYGNAIDADIYFVDKFPDEEIDKVISLMQEWGETKKSSIFNQLEKKVRVRVGKIKLNNYKAVTFFSKGIPYGFLLRNIVPISQVMLGHITQYFIFDNIYCEEFKNLNKAAIAFSPQILSKEEYSFVAKKFRENNYFVKELLGSDATVENFQKYVQIFPYDMLHIGTHGGTTEGYYITKKFTDREGQEHSFQYIEVVTFATTGRFRNGEPLIAVLIKAIPRFLDGLKWESPQLDAKKYPKYVYEDAFTATSHDNTKNDKRIPAKFFIPEAVFIQCHDGIDQGAYHQLAAATSPVIFNNSCYSWSTISHAFLGNGARGYIGTLWKIGDATAVSSAEHFYTELFKGTILDAFYKMLKQIKAKEYKDIYIYWGLHFSHMPSLPTLDIESIVGSMYEYAMGTVRMIASPKHDKTVKENAKENLIFIEEILATDFAEFEKLSLKQEIEKATADAILKKTTDEEKAEKNSSEYTFELTEAEAKRYRTNV